MAGKQEQIYGLHAVRHAIEKNPGAVLSIWVQENRQDNNAIEAILELAESHGLKPEIVTRATLDKHTAGGVHQGILLVRKAMAHSGTVNLEDIIQHPQNALPLLLILDGIQDPHNLGACLRTANAAGVDAVILPRDKSAAVTAAVRKVASGAAEVTPIITVTNLARSMKQLKDAGIWIVGTDGESDQTIYDIDMKIPMAIVLGSEGRGLRENTRKHCDYVASLPMHGIVESLNVSVTAGVCLYEVLRQRRD